MPIDSLTRAERIAAGESRRAAVPRSAHGAWAPAPDRRDPVEHLQAVDQGRIAELLPIRYGRMLADPFAFLRGAAAIMAADLATTPASGIRLQASGDCHVMNFGAYAAADGSPIFDVNDFDESLPAPFEWDLKRLAASLAVLARVRDLGDKVARGLVRSASEAYRAHMQNLARMTPLEAWQSRIALDAAIDAIDDPKTRTREQKRLRRALDASKKAYAHLVATDGSLRLPDRPPAVYRLGAEQPVASAAFAGWRSTLAEDRGLLLSRYKLRDVAFKAVGVGSVGTFCAIGLFATADGEVLVLQLKEAKPSALAPYAGPSRYENQGERVVMAQRTMQAVSDPLLSWAPAVPGERHFYVRQLKDARLAAVGEDMEAQALGPHARLVGRALARAHARSGDAAEIFGYLGEKDTFDDALAEFAVAYADQTAKDHEVFADAVRAGRVEAKVEADD